MKPKWCAGAKRVLVVLNCMVAAGICGCDGDASSVTDHVCDDLIKSLEDTNMEVRRKAAAKLVDVAYGLSQMGIADAQREEVGRYIPQMAKVVCDQEEVPDVRSLVAKSLGYFGRRAGKVAPQLIRVLLNEDDDSQVRSWVALILPGIASPEVIAPAFLVASQSKSEQVRHNASLHLGNLKVHPDILLAWSQKTCKDPSPHMRNSGIVLAARIARETHRIEALGVVLQGASDADPGVRSTALSALQVINPDSKDAGAVLVKLLEHSDDFIRVRAAAAVLAGISKEPHQKAYSILQDGLRSADAGLRATAAHALGTIGVKAKATIPDLTLRLEDEVDQVRIEAAYSLARITESPDDYVSVIVESFASNDLKARMLAPIYLQRLVPSANKVIIQSLLLSIVDDEDSHVRSLAIGSLYCVADPEVAIRVYCDALKDKSEEVRIAALDALALMGSEAQAALPRIKQARNDSSEDVRNAAQQAEIQVDGGSQ